MRAAAQNVRDLGSDVNDHIARFTLEITDSRFFRHSYINVVMRLTNMEFRLDHIGLVSLRQYAEALKLEALSLELRGFHDQDERFLAERRQLLEDGRDVITRGEAADELLRRCEEVEL